MNDEMQAANAAMSVPSPVPLEVAIEEARPRLAEEQVAYANLLDTGMKVGLLLLVLTFVTYTTGLLAPHVPLDDLPRYWSMPVRQYLAATGVHPGWGWLQRLGQGDFLNFAGIAFLAGVTIACYAAIIPIFLRKRERIYAGLAVVEVVVLALAASGLLGGGGH
jgi:hypothetical protein